MTARGATVGLGTLGPRCVPGGGGELVRCGGSGLVACRQGGGAAEACVRCARGGGS